MFGFTTDHTSFAVPSASEIDSFVGVATQELADSWL